MTSEPTKDQLSLDREERIRRRAHQLWEEAGRPEGKAQEHWERAAQDIDRDDAESGTKQIKTPETKKADRT